MEFKPNVSSKRTAPDFAELPARKPLVLLRDTERSLRRRTVEALTPVLPEPLAINLGEASLVAEESLNHLAEIDLDEITDEDLRAPRIKVGLIFVGFGALAIVFLLLYFNTLHPEISPVQQIRRYWYQYIWFVNLGVAGMFMLGREAMRPPMEPEARLPRWGTAKQSQRSRG